MSTIKEWIVENKQLIVKTYNDLHQLAEISWKEFKTKEYLINQLEQLGFSYQTFPNHTAIVAEWGDDEGPTVALRADMDALWQNVNGEWKANHSCGHDAHMTMVLNALRCLKEIGFSPKGKLKVIFQPAEESGKGAVALVEDGVVDDVTYLLGIHVRPKIEMSYGQVSAAIYHGATTLLRGTVKGVQAHGSRPNMGINVVDSIAAIVNAVNAVKVDPTIASSVKVTQINAGGDNVNIIPDEATFGIDVRAQTNEAMKELVPRVLKAVTSAGSANGSEVDVQIAASMVAAHPNFYMEQVVKEAVVEHLGGAAFVSPPITPGGEDFHFYTKEKKELQATLVGLGTDLEPGLHHPNMTFNLNALENGVAVLAGAAVKLFK